MKTESGFSFAIASQPLCMVASRNSVRGGKVLMNQILCLSFAFEYFCSEYIAFLQAAAEILCVKQEDRLASKVSPPSKYFAVGAAL